MTDTSIIEINDYETKKLVSRWFSTEANPEVAINTFSLEKIIEKATTYVDFKISNIMVQSQAGPLQELILRIYRGEIPEKTDEGISSVKKSSFEHEYKKEKMMFNLAHHLRVKLDRVIEVYPSPVSFDDDTLSLVMNAPSELQFSTLAAQRQDAGIRSIWEDVRKGLYPLSILHSYTPFIISPKDEHPFYSSLDIVTEEEMGESFTTSVSELLKSNEKRVDQASYEFLLNSFSKLAGHLLAKGGSRGVIHGSSDLHSLTSSKILYAGDTKIGFFLCDLANIFLDPRLLSSLRSEDILERIDILRVEYPLVRKEVDMATKKEVESISQGRIAPFPRDEEFQTALAFTGAWRGVTQAYEIYHSLSGYAFLPGDAQGKIKEELASQINNNLTLTERILNHFRKDQQYGKRFEEIYSTLSNLHLFEAYELKKQGALPPLQIKYI